MKNRCLDSAWHDKLDSCDSKRADKRDGNAILKKMVPFLPLKGERMGLEKISAFSTNEINAFLSLFLRSTALKKEQLCQKISSPRYIQGPLSAQLS